MSLTYADVAGLLSDPEQPPRRMLWSSTSQLQANLVHLGPDERVEPHVERDLDVLLTLVVGDGSLRTAPEVDQPLVETVLVAPAVALLPAGMVRSVVAGAHGMVYLTTHRRRPGLTPKQRPR